MSLPEDGMTCAFVCVNCLSHVATFIERHNSTNQISPKEKYGL